MEDVAGASVAGTKWLIHILSLVGDMSARLCNLPRLFSISQATVVFFRSFVKAHTGFNSIHQGT